MSPAPALVRRELAGRLQQRCPEIERATLARVYGVSDPASVGDPDYVAGLREAVAAALHYGIAGIEASAEPPPVPPQLPGQARFAARNGVALDTVLRRYVAGHAVFCDFIVEEAEACVSPGGTGLRGALRAEAALVDRLLAVIAAAYAEETESRLRHPGRRKVERVRMLLGGEPVDAADLRYELDAWHIGVIAAGPGAAAVIRGLATALDRSLLLVHPDLETVWAWLGGRREVQTEKALRLASAACPPEVSLALGEPGRGIDGWRLSHRQARAAMAVAQRGSEREVRYADVGLLAAALGDEVLAGSLRDLYLAPLATDRDRGATLRQTLRAYFAARCNISSTALDLGVDRKTVTARLRTVEHLLGRPISTCAAELETALRLERT